MDAGAIYNRTNGNILEVSYSTFSDNATTSGSGGAIYNRGNITLINNSTFSSNSSALDGGAIQARTESGNTVTVENSILTGNTAARNGGAITNYNNFALYVRDSYIYGNTATGTAAPDGSGSTGRAGGIFRRRGPVRLYDNTFGYNTSAAPVPNADADGINVNLDNAGNGGINASGNAPAACNGSNPC